MNAETLTLDENLQISEAGNSDIVYEEEVSGQKFCLNCGSEVEENFCPHCGQSVGVPERMSNKAFGKSLAMTFTRLNSGFGNTLIKLSYKPWEVIRDYIHGKQVNYSHPVTMLIQISLYSSFILMFIEGIFGINLNLKEEREGANWLIITLKESTVITTLWMAVPMIFSVYLTFWKHGSRRFSASEYIVATLYLIITIKIYTFLIAPINYLFFQGDKMSEFNLGYILVIGTFFCFVTMFKAFPIQSMWKRVVLFILLIILASTFISIYTLIFEMIDDFLMGKDMTDWLINNMS